MFRQLLYNLAFLLKIKVNRNLEDARNLHFICILLPVSLSLHIIDDSTNFSSSIFRQLLLIPYSYQKSKHIEIWIKPQIIYLHISHKNSFIISFHWIFRQLLLISYSYSRDRSVEIWKKCMLNHRYLSS